MGGVIFQSKCLYCEKEADVFNITKHDCFSDHRAFSMRILGESGNKTSFHTMENSLRGYLDKKMHQLIKGGHVKRILVKPKYDRRSEKSAFEKRDKLFNWKRPTADIKNGDLTIECFPGEDYILHYALLISLYCFINSKDVSVRFILPYEKQVRGELNKTNLLKIKDNDFVILGYISGLPDQASRWEGKGDFKWIREELNGKTVVYLGCEFSYWGDISGEIVRVLAENGNKNVIYVGKLGSMVEGVSPNEFLATGNSSLVDNKTITWDNLFSNLNSDKVIYGKHFCLPSVVLETKDWLSRSYDYDFVDPEIGRLAQAANEAGIRFSYLHIISDNLFKGYTEDLSNERKEEIVNKRNELVKSIREILREKIANGGD